MVVVFLANGFEEIEALATVDVLRRGGLTVRTAGVGDLMVIGSHGIAVQADTTVDDLPPIEELQAVVLPGGLPGTTNLAACEAVTSYVTAAHRCGALVCAICAAPSVLGAQGLLQGRKATCYPGYEPQLKGATPTADGVVVDGPCITAKGAGVTIPFALAIVAQLVSPQKAQEIGDAMQCR